MSAKLKPMPPTEALIGYLTRAYEFFNEELFDGELPPCIMHYQRSSKSFGFYHAEIFELVEEGGTPGAPVDELAINPQFVATRPPMEVLSTLVHEMVHHWQRHFGKQPSKAYHDKQWANKMEKLGLIPSDTGKPGGKRTGKYMSHYILKFGLFFEKCVKFLKKERPVFYQDRSALIRSLGRKGKPTGGEEGGGEDGEGGEDKPLSKGRVRWVCPGCELKALAKPSAQLKCVPCDKLLENTDG